MTTQARAKTPPVLSPEVPRTKGALELRSKARDGLSCLDDFRCSGAMRALFPRLPDRLEAIMINTSGGLTSGDQLAIKACAGANSHLTLTTQAAERAYRAEGQSAQVHTDLTVQRDACLQWLPQELILFDHCALNRSLTIDLAAGARLLMVEPVIFGRSAMGETVQSGHFSDRIEIQRAGKPLYLDSLRLTGEIHAALAARTSANGAKAMTSLVYIAPDAEAQINPIRQTLPQTAGVSLLHDDVLVLRMMASDSFELRRSLVPILDRLSQKTLPKSWRL